MFGIEARSGRAGVALRIDAGGWAGLISSHVLQGTQCATDPGHLARDRAGGLATTRHPLDLASGAASSRDPGRLQLVELPPARIQHRRPAVRLILSFWRGTIF